MKVFPIPHVVVFANHLCPDGKFSDDRLRVVNLNGLNCIRSLQNLIKNKT